MALRSFEQNSQGAPVLGKDESGSILIMFAVALLGLLAFAGLAIDSGNLYRAQLAAQNAADAAAMASVNYVTMRGKSDVERAAAGGGPVSTDSRVVSDQVTQLLSSQVDQLVRANMQSQGFSHSPSGTADDDRSVLVDSHYRTGSMIDAAARDHRSFEYEVNVRRNVDYLFMDLLPFLGRKYSEVQARAVSIRNVADVVLVLDFSGSLRCPGSGPCTCLEPTSGVGCPNSGNRFEHLIEGVKNFLRLFDLDKDRISFVPYNLAARRFTLQDLRDYLGLTGPLDAAALEQIADYFLAEFHPSNATNICDGLLEAYTKISELSPASENPSYVLFTDGAPTAARFLFSDTSVTGNVSVNDLGHGRYDYDLYSVSWVRPPPIPSGERSSFTGPSLLTDSNSLRSDIDGEFGVALGDPASLPDTSAPHCNNGRVRAYPVTAAEPVATALRQNFDGCLTSFQAHMPGDRNRIYGSQYSPTATSAGYRDWRKQYFHCAIELGDYIRETGKGTIYAIGLGDEKAGVIPTDPYQDLEDDTNRKDIFLSRLALDLHEAGQHEAPDVNGMMNRVNFDYREYRDFSQIPDGGQRRGGIYLPTSDPTQLRLLFQHIARKILLKMVE